MGFFGDHLQLALWNRIRKFLKKKVACVNKEDLFFLIPGFRYPCSSSGQTARVALRFSAGTRINLPIDVVAIKEGNRPRRLWRMLTMRKRSGNEQEKSTQNGFEKPFPSHFAYLLNATGKRKEF
jgi:hypothetical protein